MLRYLGGGKKSKNESKNGTIREESKRTPEMLNETGSKRMEAGAG